MNAPAILHESLQALAACLIMFTVALIVAIFLEAIAEWWEERRRARIARIEAELDQASAELSQAVFSLAKELASDRDRALGDMDQIAEIVSPRPRTR
ncbi:hypothetical protein GCM10022198_08580 [Klugiella xanthotipulae]|uniref:Uncharacterized protein n=1 Tax=Klugiella xanthotipulae TaxID=244735 RepID=A0A543I3R8_9MICO|nr:hypothetical protein [Klugiella xanthotipulae]TQM65228.1 hypothetical protein FB466_0018 [Klugiella xanthotipulae]